MNMDKQTGEMLIKLGLNIQYYRKLQNITQEELSAKSGVSEAVIGRIEAQNIYANPNTATVLKIARALDIAPKTLFDFRDDK